MSRWESCAKLFAEQDRHLLTDESGSHSRDADGFNMSLTTKVVYAAQTSVPHMSFQFIVLDFQLWQDNFLN